MSRNRRFLISEVEKIVRGDTHMTSTLKEGGRLRQKWDVIRRRGSEELASVLDVQSLFFFIKENWQEIFLLTLTLDSEAIL